MKTAIVVVSTLMLAGCATFSADGGFGAVQKTVKERTGQEVRWVRSDDEEKSVRARVREILAHPLAADDAVQLALLNNPGLQATYAALGISEADLVQAGRGPNLRLHWLRTKFGNDVTKVEESFSFDLLGVLLIPLRQKMEARRFERVQADVTAEVIRVALVRPSDSATHSVSRFAALTSNRCAMARASSSLPSRGFDGRSGSRSGSW